MSPSPRKRKRMRRKSEEMDNHHDASNSSDAHSLPSNIPSAPTQLPANIKMNSDVPDTIETKQEMISRYASVLLYSVSFCYRKFPSHKSVEPAKNLSTGFVPKNDQFFLVIEFQLE